MDERLLPPLPVRRSTSNDEATERIDPPATASIASTTVSKTTNDDEKTKEKTPNRILPILAFFLVIAVAGLGWYSYTMTTKYDALLSKYETVGAKHFKETKELTDYILELEAANKLKEELLESREGFVLSIDSFKAAVQEVDEAFSVEQWDTRVQASIATVYVERANPSTIDAEKVKVEGYTLEIYDALKAYKDDLTEKEKAIDSGEGTNPRKAIDAITNGEVTMSVVEDACGMEGAMACVSSANPKHVQISSKYLNYSYEIWYMVMMHEYAHTIQFLDYESWKNSERIKTLFNSDGELHADCMARAQIGESYVSSYGHTCTPEQITAGKEAWEGNF